MDHAWAAHELDGFLKTISALHDLMVLGSDPDPDPPAYEEARDSILEIWEGGSTEIVEALVTMEPTMRILMDAAQPGLGDYPEASAYTAGWSINDPDYWHDVVRISALRAKGIHQRGAEVRSRMRPDSPDLAADRFHPWVWDAAAPMWNAGSRQEAVLAAARSVNARLQQKLGRHDASDAKFCRESFSLDEPASGRPRLRFPGDRSSETWRSRQNGGNQLGAGCFEGIRNLAAHEHALDLPEQVALEQLAAFSLLARWIEECEANRVVP